MSLSALQMEQRQGRIGSSDIAVVLGLSPWRTPFEAWMQLTGRDPFEENDASRLGDALEPVIARLSADKLGLRNLRKVEETRLIDDWAVATPDFEVDDDAGRLLMEIKNVGGHVWSARPSSWVEHSPTGYPEYVYAQLQFQLHAFEVGRGAIGAMVSGMGPWTYLVDYDEAFARGLCKLGREWWERHIVNDAPPPVDHTDSARAYLLATYPKISRPKLVEATPEAEELARRLKKTAVALKKLERNKDLLRNQLASAVGDAQGIKTAVGTIKWGERKDGKGGTTRALTTPRWKD